MRSLLLGGVLASILLVSTDGLGQSVPHTRTIPKLLTGTFSGTASSFPFGRTGGRVQYWFRQDQLHATSLVTAIGSRPSRGYQSNTGRTQSMEVTAANTALTYAQFTNVFTTNLGAAKVLFARKNVSIPPIVANQDPDKFAASIALDAPFLMLGPNLVLQCDLGSAVGAKSAPYNTDLLNVQGAGKHFTSDPGCGGSMAATTTPAAYSLVVTGAPASTVVLLFLSSNATKWGPIDLPFKLDGLGMKGCLLGVDPQFVLGIVADASGRATLAVPFPTPKASPLVLYSQAVHVSRSTANGLATTNVVRSLIGNVGFCRVMYNFTADGPNAQYGPFDWQPALLLKP
ncbi:MAG: hypothetical protein CMJ85_11070 [Planctomycetes bacterium]|nr:hypothetical protein [Planctomycetota bacterium]